MIDTTEIREDKSIGCWWFDICIDGHWTFFEGTKAQCEIRKAAITKNQSK